MLITNCISSYCSEDIQPFHTF